MMFAIHLNDETMIVNCEIDDIGTDGNLPTDVYSIPPPEFLQFRPEFALSVSHAAPQSARSPNCIAPDNGWHDEYPHP